MEQCPKAFKKLTTPTSLAYGSQSRLKNHHLPKLSVKSEAMNKKRNAIENPTCFYHMLELSTLNSRARSGPLRLTQNTVLVLRGAGANTEVSEA
jgi:hypothetical protein